MNGEFVDTNILVYAHDRSAGRKFEIAGALIQRLLDEKRGLLSVQVLMEFYVTVTRKLAKPLSAELAEEILVDLTAWRLFSPNPSDVIDAVRLSQKSQISLWDAMIVHAADKLGAHLIWSEIFPKDNHTAVLPSEILFGPRTGDSYHSTHSTTGVSRLTTPSIRPLG